MTDPCTCDCPDCDGCCGDDCCCQGGSDCCCCWPVRP